MDVFEYYIII